MSNIIPDIPFLSVAFLDFEASSLAPDSWPIEVGFSWIDRNLEVQTYHSLIQPVPEWPDHTWSPASAAVHNIPRRALGKAPNVTQVAQGLLKVLDDQPEIRIQRMRTKWGSCNPKNGRIMVNLELAKKPLRCVEYIIAHEVVHLRVRHHSAEFIALLETVMPDWRHHKDILNSLPLAYDKWTY